MNEKNDCNTNTPCNDTNKDRKGGALGSHPVGTGLGAVGTGAVAGAAGGAIGGPVGAVAGAVVGAVVGGIAGHAAAEAINPVAEAKYWRETHSSRPYVRAGSSFDDYAPAYRYGWESFGRRAAPTQTFDALEVELGRGWDKAKGGSRLTWDNAKMATRDAWDHVEAAVRGTNGGASK